MFPVVPWIQKKESLLCFLQFLGRNEKMYSGLRIVSPGTADSRQMMDATMAVNDCNSENHVALVRIHIKRILDYYYHCEKNVYTKLVPDVNSREK